MKPSVVRADQRVVAGGLPKGVIGQQAFHHDQGWVGFLHLEPGASSPWHHHAEWDSYAYVFRGVLRWEHGPGGRDATEIGPGGVGHMPSWMIHRDVKPQNVMVLAEAAGKIAERLTALRC